MPDTTENFVPTTPEVATTPIAQPKARKPRVEKAEKKAPKMPVTTFLPKPTLLNGGVNMTLVNESARFSITVKDGAKTHKVGQTSIHDNLTYLTLCAVGAVLSGTGLSPEGSVKWLCENGTKALTLHGRKAADWVITCEAPEEGRTGLNRYTFSIADALKVAEARYAVIQASLKAGAQPRGTAKTVAGRKAKTFEVN